MGARVLVAAAVLALIGAAGAADIEKSVVKIYATVTQPNYYVPWVSFAPFDVSGSGCVIEGDLILTNAHVVSDVTYLQVRREGDPKKYVARIVAVSHEADLALITVDNPAFFEGVQPLRLGGLPRTRESVTVYGYPEGGDALSTTQGVISRIETWEYVHSHQNLLAVQIDAAINPGNSGGPALVGDRIIGVAMQSFQQAENMGYLIPVPVIQHFLDDIEDGVQDGFPAAGISSQNIVNPAMTERYGVPEEQAGVLVTGLAAGSPGARVLEPGDVIVEVDGYEIAGDGTIELLPGVRPGFSHLISRRQVGETIPMTIVRDGVEMTVEMTLDATRADLQLVPRAIYDRSPEYFIYGGLVFMPLSWTYLESAWGADWYHSAFPYLAATYSSEWRTEERDGVAILNIILPHEVNTGYQELYSEIVEEVNGVPVRGFHHLVELVENSDGEYVEFVTNLGNRIVIDREDAAASEAEIMQIYGIPSDRYIE